MSEKDDVVSEISDGIKKFAIDCNIPVSSINSTADVPCKILDEEIGELETLHGEESTPYKNGDLIICSNSTASVHNESSSLQNVKEVRKYIEIIKDPSDGSAMTADNLAPGNLPSNNNSLNQGENEVLVTFSIETILRMTGKN
jgi:hypothetical protein